MEGFRHHVFWLGTRFSMFSISQSHLLILREDKVQQLDIYHHLLFMLVT